MTEKYGQRTSILDLGEVEGAPELPDYDFWMFDEARVLRMHYDSTGGFVGASELEAAQVPRHVGYRDAALQAAVPFDRYWATHPQYWRQNWLAARG